MKCLTVVAGVLVAGAALHTTAAQAAVGTTKIVTGNGSAVCPSGYVVSGGGWSLPADTSTTRYSVSASYPYSATRWQVRGQKVTGSTVTTIIVKTYAICVAK